MSVKSTKWVGAVWVEAERILPPSLHRDKPNASPLGTYETGIAACAGKGSMILRILQNNRDCEHATSY